MLRRWWRRAVRGALFIGVLLAVALAGLGALLGTNSGTAWLLGEVAERGGVTLEYAALRGNALGRIEFDALRVGAGQTRVQVEHAVLHWAPMALLHGRVAVHELHAHGVRVIAPPAPPDPGEPQLAVLQLPAVSLPLAVDIARLEVTALRLGTDPAPVLDTLTMSLQTAGDTLRVRDLTLIRDRLLATGTLTLQLRDDWPVDARIAVSGTPAETPPDTLPHTPPDMPPDMPLELRLALGGSVRIPELELEFTAPVAVRASARADLRAATPQASVQVHWRDAVPSAAAPVHSLEGSLLLSVDGQRIEARLDAHVSGAPGGLSRLTLDGRGAFASLRPPFPMHLDVDWSAQLEAGAFAGTGSASGDLNALHLEHALQAPFHATTTGRIFLDAAHTRVDLEGEWRDLAWPPGAAQGPASPSGRYTIAGTLAALHASVDAALHGAGGVERVAASLTGGTSLQAPHAFNADLRWSARTVPLGALSGIASVHGDQRQLEFTHQLDGPDAARVDTHGTFTLAPGLVLDLAGDWRDLRWPLDGAPQLRSAAGSFAVQGAPGALRSHIDAALHADPVGDVAVRASALVGDGDARDVHLHADLLGGSVSVLGQVDWGAAVGAVLDVRARGIDPARLHPQAIGRLDAHADVAVQVVDGKPLGRVTLHALSGTLGEYPVRGEGQLALTADGFEANRIALGTGDNTLSLSGRIGEVLDLRYRIHAPALAQLWPGLGGSIKGDGTLGGTPDAPLVKAELTAAALRMGDTQAGSVSLRADVNLAEGRRSQVRASAKSIAAAGVAIDDATLALDGTRGEHRLALSANTSAGKLSLAARGGLRGEVWSGELGALAIDDTVLGDWRLARPVAITADAGGAASDQGCLHSQHARLCVDADRPRAGEQSVAVTLAGLALSRFAPWLPPGVTISGAIDASASAVRSNAGPWTARATAAATPTRIALATERTPLELTLDDVQVEATHGADGSRARLQGRLGDAGSVRGEVRVGVPEAGVAMLGGALRATVPDLAPFAALVPALRDLAGTLDADLTLAGSTARPAVSGAVNLSDARATVPAAGITIERTALRLVGDAGGGFSIDGVLNSGPGAITLRGEGRIGATGYSARVNASGERFEAMRTVPVQALISPDLVLELDPQRIALSGRVHVPQASMDIQELPQGVVQISADEVIRGREPTPVSAWRQRLRVAVDVTLGDAVHVSAFGLDTGLSGGLAMAVQGAAAPTARGTVTLVDGRFNAYGQDLQIRRGRLLFAGPLDNPGLDFRAVRDAGEVIAGIEVSGSADRMRSRVFSEPSLPQAEALAWLLTGRGLSGASSDDASVLASAAVALGLERSELVTREIGTALGLDQLSVAPGGSLDQSALVLGKALSPRLYIRYAMGLLDRQGSVQVDYRITDRISVEGESGKHQGADIIYRLER